MHSLLLSSSQSGAGQIAALLAVMAVYMVPIIIGCVCLLIGYIYMVIVNWIIFKKAGVEGWKAIIPYYNLFILFDLCFNKKTRNICFIVIIAAPLVSSALVWIPFIGQLLPVIAIAPVYLLNFAIPKVFGGDTVMCVLDIFFSVIIRSIVAFGPSEYDPSQKITLFAD
ncbi:MAG: DUF5684 domain-containing protein [Lachnospiraceae bacterium]|nr:DUF5684 domain-containing protein [Lachnospiraceae bacterium]